MISGEMNINLNYNKTLSKERILLELNSIPYSNNLIILYIDSVSRANSLRQLKKKLKFFEQFMSYICHIMELFKKKTLMKNIIVFNFSNINLFFFILHIITLYYFMAALEIVV